MTHESMPHDIYTDAEFRSIVTTLRRSVRLPKTHQHTDSPVPGENDTSFDEHVLMPGAWRRVA